MTSKVHNIEKPGLFKSTAKIFDISGKGQEPGWWLLKLDDDVALYYRWLYSRAFKSFQLPMNGPHITFISPRHDKLITKEMMNPFLNLELEFYYINKVWTNGRAFWLPAESPSLDHIRMELGLEPRFIYHISLGKC